MSPIYFPLLSLLLLLAGFLIFRVLVRRDYRVHGRLSLLSAGLESLIWGFFFALTGLNASRAWPVFWRLDPAGSRLLQLVGIVLITIGILAVIAIMSFLGLRRSFGRQVSGLIQGGPYVYSRNPQLLSGWLMILGVALRWPSWRALVWIALYALLAHWMVLTEEEHLLGCFGAEYTAYCRRVPRYLRLGRSA